MFSFKVSDFRRNSSAFRIRRKFTRTPRHAEVGLSVEVCESVEVYESAEVYTYVAVYESAGEAGSREPSLYQSC